MTDYRTNPLLGRSVLLFALLLPAFSAQAVTDPTRPPAAMTVNKEVPEDEPQQQTEIQLQQILMSSSGNRAVINGKVVKPGDSVDGAKVLSISSDTVVVNYRQNRQKLSLINKTKDVVR